MCAAAADAQVSGTWQAQDIGSVAAAGRSSVTNGTYTVSGSGADVWGANDAFHFYAQTLTGDGSIMVSLDGMTDTNGWAKAGIMIRESLAANAANVFLAATPEWHGIVAQQRSSTGGDTTVVQGPGANVPHWLRLTRTGTTITAETLEGYTGWVTLRTFNAPMGPTVYIGLAVCSHNDGTLCTATFHFGSLGPTAPPPPSAPPTPTNLTASTMTSSQISLSWATSTSATSHQVERSTDNVSFVQIGTTSGYSSTGGYTDSGLASSTTYYYRVRALNSVGPSGYSNVASATTNAPPPPPAGPWQSIDMGTATAGQTSVSGDSVTLTGSGRDIWNTADGFRYYYQPTPSGDCEVYVRVASLTNTNGWAKAGIMLRESLDPGSAHAWVCVSAEHGTAFQWRASTNGETQSITPSEDGPPPRWLKLVFKEARDYGGGGPPRQVWSFVSRDGVNWTSSGSQYLSNTWRYIGLAVTSHNDGALSTAQFDNLRYLTAPPVPSDVQVVHRGPNAELVMAWTDPATDIDRFEFKYSAQTTDHEWRPAGTAVGSARQASITISTGPYYALRIGAFRDLVESPLMPMVYVRATATPAVAISATTSNSITLLVRDPYSGLSSPQSGPWSIERSTDGVNFVEIAGNLTSSSGYDTYYTDSGLPANTTRYYRARQLVTTAHPYLLIGDVSAYSRIVTATTTSPGTAPAAPTGLTAAAISSSQITLTWTDNATDETSYEVQRSGNGTTFTTLDGNVAANSTSLTDGALSPSTIYYYRVRAVNASGLSAFSNVAQATTPASNSPPPSSTWQSGDIGAVPMAGSDSTSGTMVTVTGSGTDIWGNADSFRFRYQSLTGDGSITARVVSMTDTDGWAKAGLMIRNSLLANAANAFAAVTPEWHGIIAQSRGSTGSMTNVVAGPGATAPYWLRLTRAGSTVTAQASPDGTTWTTYATLTVGLVDTVAVGLAVTSHNQNALCTATFDNVTVTGGTAPPPPTPPPTSTWSAADIGAVGVAGANTASGTTITVSGSGADIWGTADAFRFVWQTRTGDGVVEAQVAAMANTNGWAKAGVMIRESATANAPNVFVALTPSWHGIVAQARTASGGDTTLSAGPALNAPYWVRIARSGNTFTAATSPDGVAWTTFATFNVPMNSTANFGFAVTSHDTTQLNQATFQEPYVGAP